MKDKPSRILGRGVRAQIRLVRRNKKKEQAEIHREVPLVPT